MVSYINDLKRDRREIDKGEVKSLIYEIIFNQNVSWYDDRRGTDHKNR